MIVTLLVLGGISSLAKYAHKAYVKPKAEARRLKDLGGMDSQVDTFEVGLELTEKEIETLNKVPAFQQALLRAQAAQKAAKAASEAKNGF